MSIEKSLWAAPSTPGRLFVIEGIGGSTKSTQARHVAKALQQQGYDTVETSLPYYNLEPWGPKIAQYLLDPNDNAINPKEVADWYIKNRLGIRDKWLAWLNAGKIIISARGPLSNVAYQGAKLPPGADLELFAHDLLEQDYGVNQFPREHLLVLLKAPVKVSLRAADQRGELLVTHGEGRDAHEQNPDHVQMILAIYEQYTLGLGFGTVINCAPDGEHYLPEVEITQAILRVIAPHLPLMDQKKFS